MINHNQLIAQFRSFRQHLCKLFKSYSDSIIDLIDALASNSNGAASPVELSILVADSIYSQRSFLFDASKHKNLVVIARVRSNRIFYSAPPAQQEDKKRGCPKKFGERFDLANEQTWHPPDKTTQIQSITKKGRQFTVTLDAWHHMLMRGTKEEQMYKCPFTLVRVNVTDDTGCAVWKPMWLIVMGEQRERILQLLPSLLEKNPLNVFNI